MERRYILLVVIVTLGCSSSVLSSTPSFVLSEEQTIGLSELRELRNSAVSARYDGHNPIFDILANSALDYIFDLQPTIPDDNFSTIIAEALFRDKIGVDCILDSIPFALLKPCDGIETSRNAIHTDLDEVYSVGALALGLALSGHYFDNRATFEDYHARLQTSLVSVVREIYNLLGTCLNTTNADTLAAIENAENESTAGSLRTGDAVFDAFRTYAFAITSGDKSLALVSDIEKYRVKALTGVRDEINRECCVLEALCISFCIHHTEIVSGLAVDQYTLIAKSYIVREITKTIFNEIINNVNRITFGISNDDQKVSCRIDAAQARMAALCVAANNFTLQSILFIHPGESRAIRDAKKALLVLTNEISAVHFQMMKVALDQSKTFSNVIAEINILKNVIVYLVMKHTRMVFALIRNNQIWSDEIEAEFANVTDKIILQCEHSAGIIRDGMQILAEVAHGNGTVGTDSISGVRDTERRATSAGLNYIQLVAEAFLISLLANQDRRESN